VGAEPRLICLPCRIRKEVTAMMSTAPPLLLTRDQVGRLQGYVQTYRHHAFISLLPSTGRNHTLRILQAIQGKLIEVMDQKTAVLQLVLTAEEIVSLKSMITELLALFAQQPESTERIATLADLAALKSNLKGW
jgi:hypothetical protein